MDFSYKHIIHPSRQRVACPNHLLFCFSPTLRQMILCSACHHWSFGAQAFVQIADHVGHIALCKLDLTTCIFTCFAQLHIFGKHVFQLFAGFVVSSHRVSQLATILSIPPQCAWAQKQCAPAQKQCTWAQMQCTWAQKRAHKAAHPLKDRCGVHL